MNQTINVGKRQFTIHHFTGKVASASKNMETKVSGGGGGGGSYQGTGYSAPVSITSKTVVHDQLFLVDKEGHETALQLQDFHLACREGNIVTASWAIQPGTDKGIYFAVTNHSTNQQFINEKVVRRIVINGIKRSLLDNKSFGVFLALIIFALIIFLFIKFPIVAVLLIIAGLVNSLILIPSKSKSKIQEFVSSIKYPNPDLW